MLAQHKTNIIQITAYIPVMLKDFYYNPSTDHKNAVLKKIKKTNLFLKEWKNTLLLDEKNKLKVSKTDVQFIQKFANMVKEEDLKKDKENVVLVEANVFSELLADLGKVLERKINA